MYSVTDDAIDMLNFTDSALEVPSLDELNSQEIKRFQNEVCQFWDFRGPVVPEDEPR